MYQIHTAYCLLLTVVLHPLETIPESKPDKFHAQPLHHQADGQLLFVAPWCHDKDWEGFFRNQAQYQTATQ